MDSGAAIDMILTNDIPTKLSWYDCKPLICSSAVSNPIMMVRYSKQSLPGYIRFYDNSLNPQIDSLDYVYTESQNSKFSEPDPDGHIQLQCQLSVDVDLCDHHPPLFPRRPACNLDHPQIQVCSPATILARCRDSLPISLPSFSPPYVYLWERNTPQLIRSLHGHHPSPIKNFTQFTTSKHLQPVTPRLSDQSPLIMPAHHPPMCSTHLPTILAARATTTYPRIPPFPSLDVCYL
ncbi:hypothetical protein ARMGADRAFT_1089213 [Armillaria gallica]|uniref:Uncharacterized protein n=1 Tax=Armillaria gallica TaxID=47427 RepID=A0A2H3CYL4_ARMGA|nr:hypothetical protein ARMGADRAFT_1089213 [Armillaria gallica]